MCVVTFFKNIIENGLCHETWIIPLLRSWSRPVEGPGLLSLVTITMLYRRMRGVTHLTRRKMPGVKSRINPGSIAAAGGVVIDFYRDTQISGQPPGGCPLHSNANGLSYTISWFSPSLGIAPTCPGNLCYGFGKNLGWGYQGSSGLNFSRQYFYI